MAQIRDDRQSVDCVVSVDTSVVRAHQHSRRWVVPGAELFTKIHLAQTGAGGRR